MNWNSLSETLVELAASVTPSGEGLVVTEAEITIPLEIRLDRSRQGLIVRAQPGHSRWKAGFLPPVHLARMTITGESGDVR